MCSPPPGTTGDDEYELANGCPLVSDWRRLVRENPAGCDVANLQSGGATVDLGSVACVENDSPDANTVGSEDALQPVPGQVLFYLYRGIDDLDVGTGSYDTSSDGDERVTAAGDCSTVVL